MTLGFEADLPSLAQVWADYFLIGTAVMPRDLTGPRWQLVSHHFNTLTAENHMKPDHIQPSPGNFTFEQADNIVNTGRANNMTIVGHTLAWHSQSPPWMNPAGISREEAIENLENHIREVMTRYAGQVAIWDVVNEAFPSSVPIGTSTDWRANLRPTPWLAAIGYEYIEIAFRTAHAVDPTAILIYNDYNLDAPGKRNAVFHMVRELLEMGVPIHGIGMQAHYNTATRIQNVEDSIQRFASLGVQVHITELDVTVTGSQGQERLTEAQELRQAIVYAELFRVFRNNAEHIPRVTFWGIDDATSWRADRFPLLFNSDLTAKLAFHAILDPDTFLAAQGID
jgi:endo-1,4-beta-xylanase